MGRYYDGDINGKFWFGVQDSDDASFFGGDKPEPQCLEYFFNTKDLPKIESGLATCKEKLSGYTTRLDKFFKRHAYYNDEMLVKSLKVDKAKVSELLEWYARLELGTKIRKCVKKQGTCSFIAEM